MNAGIMSAVLLIFVSFFSEVEPFCPVTALWIDMALDTAFVGDARSFF